jgi:primosomal protein N''
MKHVTLALTATVVLASTTLCEAGLRARASRQAAPQQQPAAPQYSPQQAAVQPQEAQPQGFFQRLMEMERRKNERLRQMFFGR